MVKNGSGRVCRPFLLIMVLLVFIAGHSFAEEAGAPPEPTADKPSEEKAPEEKSGQLFSESMVEDLARQLAEQPYRTPEAPSPNQPEMLDAERWIELNKQLEPVLWDGGDQPFFVRLLTPGYIFPRTIALFVVDADGKIEEQTPHPAAPQEAGSPSPDSAGNAPVIGGFSLGSLRGLLDDAEEIPYGTYLGTIGSGHLTFRGRKARQRCFYRTPAVNTVTGKEEVYTHFRQIWLIKPKPGDTSFVFHALLDSTVLTGAFRFEVVPGVTTVTHVREKLFKRPAVPFPEKIGIAPLASMFLYSETQNRPPGDYRPEVHNSDGLLIAEGGSWFWRPLNNPERLLVSSFPADGISGFGLLQRDRNFDHYQDLDNRFEQSSSVWVEVDGNWGPGSVELVEIPGNRDSHTNMLAYWVPDMAKLRELMNADSLSLSYRLYWMPPGSSPHELGRVSATRYSRSAAGDAATFVIDFEGGELARIDADMGLTSVVDTPEQVTLLEKNLVKNPETGGWRLFLKFSLPQDGMLQNLLKAREGAPRLRFAARLKRGENIPQPLTETWVYNLTP